MKEQKGIIIKHKQNPKLSEHYIQVQFSPLRRSYKHLATHHYTSGHSWFPVLGRVLLSPTRGPSETCRAHPSVSFSSVCHQSSSDTGKSLFPPSCSASSQVLPCVHTGTSESHCTQSCGSDQSEIQFSWLFFTQIQLPIGFTKHSHECLCWNIVVNNWRQDKTAGRGWEGTKWLQRWGLVFSASPPVWKSSNSTIKKLNRKWLTFQIKIGGFLKIPLPAQLTVDLWKDLVVKKSCHIGCDSKTKTCSEPILLLWPGLLSGNNLSVCSSPGAICTAC